MFVTQSKDISAQYGRPACEGRIVWGASRGKSQSLCHKGSKYPVPIKPSVELVCAVFSLENLGLVLLDWFLFAWFCCCLVCFFLFVCFGFLFLNLTEAWFRMWLAGQQALIIGLPPITRALEVTEACDPLFRC